MYKNIIVAIDLSHGDAGKTLLDKARKILDADGVVRLLHVLEDVPGYVAAELPRDLKDRRQAEAKVELGVIAGDTDASVKIEIRRGSAAGQILQCAEDCGADLIMIASHRPGFSDYFIGSTASRVVRHAQCSVLIAR